MMNDYYQNSDYDFGGPVDPGNEENIVSPEAVPGGLRARPEVDFNDKKIGTLPKILLMGPRRSGKTSIQRVVFQKMSPHETLFRLEATQELERSVVDHTSLCRFTIWDFPGDYYALPDDLEATNNDTTNNAEETKRTIFQGSTSLLFVVDAQDEPYDHVLQSFTNAVTQALTVNPSICVEVFINKVDGELFLSDESKYDCRRDIMSQVTDELAEAGVSPDNLHIRYHLTSIYDHSIYEALSRVVQRLIPQLPTLENLLNVLVSTCSMEKAYLFDVVSKLYISTDSGPVDMQSVELCSDMIDVVLDVSGIYGLGPENPPPGEDQPAISNGEGERSGDKQLVVDPLLPSTLASQVQSDDIDDGIIHPDSAYDSESASVIRLSNGMVLYLKEVDTMLALVCITRSENFRKKSMINHNIGQIKKALHALV
ncbi:Ras-related GTP-binding protein C [Seminavis robusta]|uniref:Ras-related GTP-binding protein C n=1 Tax=Seminavis robusta TaxID=568900 RepID=A0A9N8F0E1_9STRA|nr:Ras-related GTP-binding protein C [Seminavis robusta]|eukprot:Sro2202_g318920.1 Ras-related GTP-binding protein C (426) ;mRNA; r:12799-14477